MSPRSTVLSPAADRDLMMVGLFCAVAALVCATGAVLVLGGSVAAVLAGAPLWLPAPAGWTSTALSVLGGAADPGAAVGGPWAALAGRGGLYWATTAALFVLLAAPVGVLGRWGWVRFGPTPAGHATRAEIRAELSPAAARERARFTRPGMAKAARRRAPLEEVGAPLHHGPIGAMCTPLENPTGTLAPTQTGKTRRDLAHKVLAAPGALLCSTTKPDLLELTGLARTRRPEAGPVLVFDLTGAVAWPAVVRWSPIQGCADPRVADRRAHTLVEASAVVVESGGGHGAGNDKVFRERATVVLGCYLLAAAVSGRAVDALVEWATKRETNSAALRALSTVYPEQAENLRAELSMTARTADAVWMSVRRAIAPLLDPHIRELCSPPPGHGFDARSVIGNQGSLYLIAGQQQAAATAPLLTALAEYWLETAREMALHHPSRRLDPPATAVLDEVANATPIPSLPATISDSAGRGVMIHWAAQSKAQLDDTFGADRASMMMDNTTTLSLWGGLKDAKTLEWAATLFGHHERPRWQTHSDGFLSPGRTSIGTETAPTFRPGDVRMLPRNKVLIAHRDLAAVVATTRDVSQRRDWRQLRGDVDAVRDGRAAVDLGGYSTSAHGTHHARAVPARTTAAR